MHITGGPTKGKPRISWPEMEQSLLLITIVTIVNAAQIPRCKVTKGENT